MTKFFGKSVKRKLLASFLVVLVIPMLVGAVGYVKLRDNMISEAQRAYVDKLGQAVNGVNGLYDELDHLTDALKNTQWVGKIAYMQGSALDYRRTTVYDLSVYAAELKNYQSLNNYIDRIMIVFPQKGLVMSMNGVSTMEDFFNTYYQTNDMSMGQWKTLLGSYTDGMTLQPMDVSNYSKKARLLTYIKTINLPSDVGSAYVENAPIATLMISVVVSGTKADGTSAYGIQNLLEGVSGADGASSYIMNGNGVVASYNAKGLDFSGSLPALQAGDRTAKPLSYSGKGYYAIGVKSQLNAWQYVAVVPRAAVMQPVNASIYWLIALFLLCTLASFALAYALFRSNYMPLKSLMEHLKGIFPRQPEGSAPVPQNEYSLIDQAFQQVVAQGYNLQDKLEFLYPMAVHSFFFRLLYDIAGKVDDQAAMKSLGINEQQNGWTVAVLYSEGDDAERTKAAKWVFGNLPVYMIEIDSHRYAAIIHSGDASQAAEAVKTIRENSLRGGESRVIVGIGNPCEGLAGIGRSYHEALSAVNYCFNEASGQDCTVNFGAIEPDRSFGCHIRQETEDELQKLLRSGNTALLKEYLEPFMDKQIKKAGASFVSLQIFFYNLLSIALKAAAGGELSMSMLVDEQRLMMMNTAHDMKAYIGNVYMMVCESLRSERRGHAQKVRTDILKFVDENCLDDKLTLQLLSDLFGVTVPYLSKFIKDQTGNNFLDYVARKRIQIAKEMLKSGDCSIQQVGESVGYVNALTFRRVFKKIEGVNPGDYRARSGSA